MKSLWKNWLSLFAILIIFSACLKEETAEEDLSLAAQIAQFNAFRLIEKKKSSDANLTHHLHLAGNAANTGDCSIPAGSLDIDNPAQITCWLDVEELDLYFEGIDVELNVPPSVCEYVIYRPYWFYQWPVGGTSDVVNVYNKPENDSGSSLCTQTCNFVDEVGAVQTSANCNTLVGNDVNDGNVNFFFDYTDVDGPNCDYGSVTIRTFDFEDNGGGNCTANQTPNTRVVNSDGEFRDCWASPVNPRNGLTQQPANTQGTTTELNWPEDVLGLPMDLIWEGSSGLIESFAYDAPIAHGLASNIVLANYTYRAGAGGLTAVPPIPEPSSFGWPDAEQYYVPQRLIDYARNGRDPATSLPSGGEANIGGITNFHDPFWKPGGNSTAPSPFYEFICANRAREFKGRILLQVRDINERFDVSDQVNFPLFKAKITNPALDFMDNTLTQIAPILDPLNDFADWDDFRFPGAPASTDLGSGSLINGVFATPTFSHPGAGL